MGEAARDASRSTKRRFSFVFSSHHVRKRTAAGFIKKSVASLVDTKPNSRVVARERGGEKKRLDPSDGRFWVRDVTRLQNRPRHARVSSTVTRDGKSAIGELGASVDKRLVDAARRARGATPRAHAVLSASFSRRPRASPMSRSLARCAPRRRRFAAPRTAGRSPRLEVADSAARSRLFRARASDRAPRPRSRRPATRRRRRATTRRRRRSRRDRRAGRRARARARALRARASPRTRTRGGRSRRRWRRASP